ncbi:Spc98 family-domain-containing protein [Xylariaceae sp. FL0016]|nr:Spc98 family-domain-containing protein [Xylariaceae sp. FL0016]
MAFAATLGALTDELVEVITSTSNQSDPDRFNVLRESGLRRLKTHSFLRTNHFEVQDALVGLEEHFRVVSRDGLADALRERLEALVPHTKSWTPEALQLLLLLSDQPVQKSKLSDLDLLKEPEVDPDPVLKWDEIAKEEGWENDRNLWKNVDFRAYSSEDDSLDEESARSLESEETYLSSVEARHRKRPADYIDPSGDDGGLDAIRQNQSWRSATTARDATGRMQKVVITELQAVREVFFMLHGLDNTLFDNQGTPSLSFQLSHASWQVYKALLVSFGEAGRQLSILRTFARQPQQIPLLQVFSDSIQKRIRCFDYELSVFESHYLSIEQDVVVSLTKILNQVNPHLQPLACLADIIQELERARHPRPFHYLELLYDAACVTQLEGNDSVYGFVAQLFFECFGVYLRPIRLWMSDGELVNNDKTFFISSVPSEVPRQQIWADQFKLRKTAEGKLHAPRFLQPAASKIFTTGKSVVVLKLLGSQWSTSMSTPEAPFRFGVDSVELGSFMPFSEIFNGMFERWMQGKHHAASTTLRQTLFKTCDLWSVLDALERVYLMSNGSCSDNFVSAIFNNIDLLDQNWHDRYNLTSIAQEAFDDMNEAHRIAVSVSSPSPDLDVNDVRKSVRVGLPSIKVDYRLTWPTRIIISDNGLDHYQSVLTFLLQLRRATYILHRHRLMCDGVAGMNPDQALYYGVRSGLLWFCNTVQSYLTTLVLGPLSLKVREDLRQAGDVDAMIAAHSSFIKTMVDEACLGNKLDPIRQCILDIFDLTIRLQDARQLDADKREEEEQELSRLSVMSSPMKSLTRRYVKTSEEEDETFLAEQDKSAMMRTTGTTYSEVLLEIRSDFNRHLRFICSALRGVSRATNNAASTRWDTLAEMLEVGVQGN